MNPDGMTILYEDYKEPLKTVKEVLGSGYGYIGTLAMSSDREYIQCHICGKLFKTLGRHLDAHKITAKEYKIEFGLSSSTALMGDSTRNKHKENIAKQDGLPKHLEGYNEKRASGILKSGGGKISLQERNKRGICPDQVLERILDLKEKLGRTPSFDEFQDEYKGRFRSAIQYQHGSWTNAIHKLGDKTRGELRKPDENDLLSEIKDFYDRFGKIPTSSDFNRRIGLLRDKNVYIRAFGSLNDARILAGLNALVPISRYMYKEITPQEYFDYKDGHIDLRSNSKSAIRARERRRKIRETAYKNQYNYYMGLK